MAKKLQRPMNVSPLEGAGRPFSDDSWVHRDAIPFTVIPSWWRGFLFRVLDPIDLAVYCYLCSFMGRQPVAFPTLDQIQSAVNRSLNPVRDSLNRLEKRHFILLEPVSRRRRRGTIQLYRFQRPRAIATVLHLLAEHVIDENFIFIDHASADPEARDPNAVVALGLKSMMGPRLYTAYDSLRKKHLKKLPRRFRIAALIAVLRARLAFTQKAADDTDELLIDAKERLRQIEIAGTKLPISALDGLSTA